MQKEAMLALKENNHERKESVVSVCNRFFSHSTPKTIMCIFFVEKVKKVLTKKKRCSTIITVRGIPSAKDKHREKGDFMKKKWFSALAALAVLSFAAAPMNGYAVDEESLDDELAVAVTTEAPVIAGTVVTTDTQMQTTSSSVYTTVTDEYGNGLDENGNIVPATTSVSTQTETTTTTTTTKASTELSQIPLSGTYTVRIRIRDIVRQTPVLGLNCEVFCLQTGDVVAKWNTSDVDEIYIENLKYEFNSYNSYTGNIRYAIRITNMPENYVFFYGKDKEVYGLTGLGLEEFKYGTDLDCTVKLEDTSDDAPKYTYVTGTHPIVTTSTAPVADTTEPISNTTAPKDTGTTISIPVTDPETSVTPVPGTTAPTETNTTVTTKTTETLPQTGYSNGYRWLIGAAILMTVTGAGIVLRTKKETK